ncbi:MAG TPA: hypothetical protein VFD92_15875 [Candidatus Binatia bacterium]|nr:hypothetical protein [Candidatus Binatia bacterium]
MSETDETSVDLGVTAGFSATADVRYSFTAQFLIGAAFFSRCADAIEREAPDSITEVVRSNHRAYVVAAITQAVAALDAEIWEVCVHGPGHHLGSGDTDIAARDFLAPMAEVIDGEDTLSRYKLVLHLLHKETLDRGAQPSQDAALLVKLRNALVHYKSKWGVQLEDSKTFAAMMRLQHPRPPFIPASGVNFFPHQCLSAGCAAWAVDTAVAFLDSFYLYLGIPSILEPHRASLATRS